MDDEQARDLGRRLTACPSFKWMPGMLTGSGRRIIDRETLKASDWPDVRDPATMGCVSDILRSTRGGERHAYWDGPWQSAVVGAIEHCDEQAKGVPQ